MQTLVCHSLARALPVILYCGVAELFLLLSSIVARVVGERLMLFSLHLPSSSSFDCSIIPSLVTKSVVGSRTLLECVKASFRSSRPYFGC